MPHTAHRLCHENRTLYQYVHKYHHQWVDDTVACTCIACHPVEHVLVNLTTVNLPFALTGCPFVLCVAWTGFAVVITSFSHCGYETVISSMSGMPHHYHHTFQTVFYGAGGYFDYLFKTRLVDVYPKRWHELTEVPYLRMYKSDWRYE